MTLRELLYKEGYNGRQENFVEGYFQLVGSFSGKIRFKSWYNTTKKLEEFLDLNVSMINSGIWANDGTTFTCYAKSFITIRIDDYDITQKEMHK